MIKFASRPNMKYLVGLFISSFIRYILQNITDMYFTLDFDLIYLFLMFLGEFLFGLLSYSYQLKYVKQKKLSNNFHFMTIKLITNDKIQINDNKYKIYFLITATAFFDFMEYILFLEFIPSLVDCSYSFEERLSGILIILDSLFYRFVLNLPIFKHQFFSIIIMSICLIITIAIEFIFQDINYFFRYADFVFLIFKFFIVIFFNSLLDLIEKYLFEYDYLNPFKLLMLEGIIGFSFGIIYCIYKNPISSIKNLYYYNSDNFVYLVLSLLLFMILSGIQNTFRVVTNKIYSPMASTLALYFFNPIYIIITLILNDDFVSKEKRNYLYFSINFVLTIIVSFSGLVYNEFIILFFCGLQHDTYKEISYRASLPNDKPSIYNINDIDDEDSNA